MKLSDLIGILNAATEVFPKDIDVSIKSTDDVLNYNKIYAITLNPQKGIILEVGE